MSYDISLRDPVTKETIEFDSPHHMRGGTYALGGTAMAWLNVTYNYAPWYYKDGVFPNRGEITFEYSDGGTHTENCEGIRSIYGLTGAESISVLTHAINMLEDMDEDISEEEKKEYEEHGASGYWMPTRENAIKPLYQLLAMAKMRPDGIWEGD